MSALENQCFFVPGEPVALGRARAVRMGKGVRMYTPEASRSHKEVVARYAIDACIRSPEPMLPCVLDVVAVWPIPLSWSKGRRAEADEFSRHLYRCGGVPKVTKPDADNVAKLVADALIGIAYTDDNLVWQVRVAKVWGPTPGTHVRLCYGANLPDLHRWW